MEPMHKAIKDRRKGMAVTIIIPTAEEMEAQDNEGLDPDADAEEIGVSPGEIENIPEENASIDAEVGDKELAALSKGAEEYPEGKIPRTLGEKIKMQAMKLRKKV